MPFFGISFNILPVIRISYFNQEFSLIWNSYENLFSRFLGKSIYEHLRMFPHNNSNAVVLLGAAYICVV
jgi:hypothetical protein